MDQCPDCGGTFRPGEPACPHCGLELLDSEECPQCRAVNWGMTPDGRLECASCGYVDRSSEG